MVSKKNFMFETNKTSNIISDDEKLTILSYLSFKDLIQISKVNKHWNELSKSKIVSDFYT